MNPQIERRSLDDELSPDILALLESCGGQIRKSDSEELARRRGAVHGTGMRRRSGDDPAQAEATGWLADLPGSGA